VASEISMIMDAAALRPSRQALMAERWSCQITAIQSRASIVSERFSTEPGGVLLAKLGPARQLPLSLGSLTGRV
jgi:hypothetical protein